MMLNKAQLVCGVVTVPDGRVLVHRLVSFGGATPWTALLSTNSFDNTTGLKTVQRLVRNRLGALVSEKDIKHVLSHSKSPVIHYLHLNDELEIYHVKFKEEVSFTIDCNMDTMAMTFERIIDDLQSGAWQEQSVTVFNLLNTMCREDFVKWN